MSEDTTPTARTLIDLVQQRAERYRDKVAFSFSENGDDENSSRLTYRELDIKARAIASSLQQQGAAGQRVLVLCNPGLDAVAGFFGCVYAGAVAVPLQGRSDPRLTAVVPDAQAGFVLATAETQVNVRARVDDLVEVASLRWCLTDAVLGDPEKWVAPDVDPDAAALLQYTSGSTRSPRGVVVTHRNILHNIEAIVRMWGGDDHTIAVWCLPLQHDMGLIGGIVGMLWVGCTTYLMSPIAFIKRPMRWLEAISRRRATFTAASNFGYEQCVERSTAEERAALDLSSLSVAMNGGEPVRASTVQRFAEAFAPAGFRLEAFLPVYGLAEATLMISGGPVSRVPLVQHIARTALREDRVVDVAPDNPGAVAMVGCGQPQGGDVVIVDPVTHRPCGPDEVGEIWVAGLSVARGYRGRPEETELRFSAFLSGTAPGTPGGPFLRTGDLGFLRSGELFITGRCKDLITIRGGNYYPSDIELTVQTCHPVLVLGRGAAFAVTPGRGPDEERLVVVQEVVRHQVGEVELTDVLDAIRTAITERHGLAAHAVVLVEHLRIPTTSSGKIQRGLCRQLFLDGKLEPVAEWHAPSAPDDFAQARKLTAVANAAALMKVAAALRDWASRQA